MKNTFIFALLVIFALMFNGCVVGYRYEQGQRKPVRKWQEDKRQAQKGIRNGNRPCSDEW